MEKFLPDYNGGSIVNLMSSIGKACGGKTTYPTLRVLPPEEIAGYKNVVLIVIDGLGYEYLAKYGKGSFLQEHLKSKMTSVFPSTTAAAITTFATGLAPQQHAITGWFMQMKELGGVVAALPFKYRTGSGINEKTPPSLIFHSAPLTKAIPRKNHTVSFREIIDSQYSSYFNQVSKKHPYSTLSQFFSRIESAVRQKGSKYIYAYWWKFDHICHELGTKDKSVFRHFTEIDDGMRRLAKRLARTDTLLLITADHGLINTPLSKMVVLNDHPTAMECLSSALSGEPRVAYCYVKPSKRLQFEKYVRARLSKQVELHKSEDLVAKGYFGLYKPDPRLHDRIGDYVLILKQDHTIRDLLAGEKKKGNLGNHGGVSAEEMFVPLIVIRP